MAVLQETQLRAMNKTKLDYAVLTRMEQWMRYVIFPVCRFNCQIFMLYAVYEAVYSGAGGCDECVWNEEEQVCGEWLRGVSMYLSQTYGEVRWERGVWYFEQVVSSSRNDLLHLSQGIQETPQITNTPITDHHPGQQQTHFTKKHLLKPSPLPYLEAIEDMNFNTIISHFYAVAWFHLWFGDSRQCLRET